MPDSMVLELDLPGFSAGGQEVGKLAGAVEKLGKQMEAMAKSVGSVSAAQQRLSSATRTAGPATRALGNIFRPSDWKKLQELGRPPGPKPRGLMDELRDLRQTVGGIRALSRDTPFSKALGVLRLGQVAGRQGGAAGAANEGFDLSFLGGGMGAFGEALEGLTPALAGVAAAAGPLAIGFLVVDAALKLFQKALQIGIEVAQRLWAALRQGAEFASRQGAAAAVSGGTTAEIARLASLGVSAGQAAAMGAALREALTPGKGSAMQFMAASRLGLGPQLPEAFGGPLDNARLLMQAMEQLRSKPIAERLRTARMLGPEFAGMLPGLNVSENVNQSGLQQARNSGAILTDTAVRKANDFNEALRQLDTAWNLVLTAFGRGSLGPLTRGLLDVSSALQDFAKTLAAHPALTRGFARLFEYGILVPLSGFIRVAGGFAEAVGFLLDGTGKLGKAILALGEIMLDVATGDLMKAYQDAQHLFDNDPKNPASAAGRAQAQATAANTQALNSNTAALAALGAKVYGGGTRAQGALAPGLSGFALSEAYKAGAIRMGMPFPV